MNITRRSLLSSGAAATLTAAIGVRPASSQESALYEAAKAEGELNLYWGTFEQKTIEDIIAAFKARYPGINVNLLRQASQTVYTRLRLEIQNNQVQCDSLGTTNVLHYQELKSIDGLRAYKPADKDALPDAVKVLDNDDFYHIGSLSLISINRSSSIEGPASWAEMVGGKYAGEITCGSPAHSGDVAHWTVAMLAKYGDNFLRDFAAQKPKIGQSNVDTVTDILAGERKVGAAAPYSYSLTMKASGNPIDVTIPTDDAILNLGITAVPAKAPHPNAGQLFNEFLYSPEVSRVLVSNNWPALRSDVAKEKGVNIDVMSWYRNPPEGLAEAMVEAIAKWREIVA